jgi:hypothetical protein
LSSSAVIEIGSIFAWVRPGDVAPLLTPALCYTSTLFAPNELGGFTKVRRRVCHCELEAGGAFRILIGHVTLVQNILENAGLTVTVQDHRQFGVKATPNLQAIREARGNDRTFLEVVGRHPRGLIEVRSQADMLRFSALICKLFPMARIFIPVATRKQVVWTRRELQRTLSEPVNVVGDYSWPWEGGRLVCTLRAFPAWNADDLEVIICPEAAHAVVPGHFRAFGRLPFQRVYGFVRAGKELSAKSRFNLEGLFGPVVYGIADPRGPEATVQVHWCIPPACYPVGDLAALERKRRSYWSNDRRNALIAAVAGAFRAGNRESLWQHGLFLAEDEGAFLFEDRRSVAILVESAEHGRELHRRLPGWNLWDAMPTPPTPNNLPPGVQSIWDLGVLDQVILTLARASRLETVYTDMFVVASGQGWPDALRGFPPRSVRGDHQVVLVDLADDFDEVARQATLRRQRAYAGRGWRLTNTPAWLLQVQ